MSTESTTRLQLTAAAPSTSRQGARNAGIDKIRVLIADDHVTVTAGLVSIIGM